MQFMRFGAARDAWQRDGAAGGAADLNETNTTT
jgi:hypothetical protein